MTKQYKTFSWLVATAVLLLVLAGCVTSASLPPGTYTASISAEDYFPLPNYSSTKFESYIVGDWEIKVDEEHRYVVTKDGDFLAAEGHCTMTEDQIVFTDEKGPWACTLKKAKILALNETPCIPRSRDWESLTNDKTIFNQSKTPGRQRLSCPGWLCHIRYHE